MKRLRATFLFATVLLTGGVVMAFEILGARLLSVCYGGSMHVWAAMISVTLLSLSAGYFVGGVLADRKPVAWVLYTIILASGVFGCVAPYARFLVGTLYGGLSIAAGTLASSMTIFFVPLALLGMCSPYVIRLLSTSTEGAGKTAGGVYAVSTVGCVAGTLMTSLWLVPAFGAPMSFRIAGAVLIGVAAIGLAVDRSRLGLLILIPAALAPWLPDPSASVGAATVAPDGTEMRLVHTTETSYGRLAVVDKGPDRLLLMNGILQTGMPIERDHLERGAELQHARYLLELVAYCSEDTGDRRALLVGLAGGLMAEILKEHGIETTAIEIDPNVVAVAREFFHFDGKAIVGDGRRAIESLVGPYDICVIDTYSGDVFPFHMASVEMWREVARLLGERGVLGVNYIGFPDDKAMASLLTTIGAVFSHVRAFRTEDSADAQTICVLASQRDLELSRRRWLSDIDSFQGVDPVSASLARLEIAIPEPGLTLRDDHNPIDFHRARAALRWREKTTEIIGPTAARW